MCQYLVEKLDFTTERMYRLRGGLNKWKQEQLPVCEEKGEVWGVAADRCWRRPAT
eukprot:CAMPEP_0175466480 /NCGR_PEP_ID=MMETSP0095-20121207/70828_1 /TAXON_ID=311494 /ORGANISM="Alexandrium monilatum, Strain CCMP3105" /LENGTH=54 /DNA_ID=CAMNT_0016767827 /DNA_START=1 /DNA_END=162 /DNA_ORIENTATION=+